MTQDLETMLRKAASALPAPPLPDLGPPAAASGLLDVAYAIHDSPLGTLLLAATPRGLVRIAYTAAGVEAEIETLARALSPRVLSAPGRLDEARRELDQYFEGRRHQFDLELDRRLTRGFVRRVLDATARIPYGSVSTYGLVAAQAGSPRGSRAAGNALGANPLPIVVPCHRVVRTGGALGGYGGGPERKRILLEVEGAPAELR
jgi:methylated-DNA-[protein]-cysteine S-methyltransferase